MWQRHDFFQDGIIGVPSVMEKEHTPTTDEETHSGVLGKSELLTSSDVSETDCFSGGESSRVGDI